MSNNSRFGKTYFKFDPGSVVYDRVEVVGSWDNSWAKPFPLEFDRRQREWHTTVDLPVGAYEFKFKCWMGGSLSWALDLRSLYEVVGEGVYVNHRITVEEGLNLDFLLGFVASLLSYLRRDPPRATRVQPPPRLRQLKIVNWATFDDISVDFPSELITYLFGPGDAGKTNLIRAVDFAFAHAKKTQAPTTNLMDRSRSASIELVFSTNFPSVPLRTVEEILENSLKTGLRENWLTRNKDRLLGRLKEGPLCTLANKALVPSRMEYLPEACTLLRSLFPDPEEVATLSKDVETVELLIKKQVDAALERLQKVEDWRMRMQVLTAPSGDISTSISTFTIQDGIETDVLSLLIHFAEADTNVELLVKEFGVTNIASLIDKGKLSKSITESCLRNLRSSIFVLPRDEGLLDISTKALALSRLSDSKRSEFAVNMLRSSNWNLIEQKFGPMSFKGVPKVTLYSALHDIERSPDLLTSINAMCEEDLGVHFFASEDKTVGFSFNQSDRKFTLSDASGTVLHALVLYYALANAASGCLILDEPVSMWHPSIVWRLRERLLGLRKTKSIITITHSPTLLKFQDESHVYRCFRKAGITRLHSAKLSSENGQNAQLDIMLTRSAIFSEFVVVVEGLDELRLMTSLQHAVDRNDPLFTCLQAAFILPLKGTGNLKEILLLLRNLNIPFVLALDSDKLDNYKRAKRDGKQDNSSNSITALNEAIKVFCENATATRRDFKSVSSLFQDFATSFRCKSISDLLEDALKRAGEDSNNAQNVLRKFCAENLWTWVWPNALNGDFESAFNKSEHHSIRPDFISSLMRRYKDSGKLLVNFFTEEPDCNQFGLFLQFLYTCFTKWRMQGDLGPCKHYSHAF